MLIGHDSAIRQFESARLSGRLHHAWLLAGPEGVGKRSFADMMARDLLGVDGPEHPGAHLLEAGTHPDLRVLAPPEEGKGAAQGVIVVDAVRGLRAMLHGHPAMGRWRIIIIDAVDDLNPNAANALLKEVEEPAKDTIFFLISHAPGRLLPTIRSRCRLLRFGRLPDSEVADVLVQQGLEPEDAFRMAALADGRPGLALAVADEAGLAQAVDDVIIGSDPLQFARAFQPASAVNRFALMIQLVPVRLAKMARQSPSEALLDAQAEADRLGRDAIRLAFDRVQVAFALARLLAKAGEQSQKQTA